MIIMGTNTWEIDIPEKILVIQALRFGDQVKEAGIAQLRNFYLAYEKNLLWCTWDTENLEELKNAFADMNEQSGLKSTLHIVEDKYPY